MAKKKKDLETLLKENPTWDEIMDFINGEEKVKEEK